jgi:formate dehydrogenase subunit gamma
MSHAPVPARMIRRLHPLRLVEHHLNALAFFTLVFTGLIQKFHGVQFCRDAVAFLGGIDATRTIHRTAGAAMALLLVNHLAVALWGLVRRGWQPSMMPNLKDLGDVVTNLRFYVGLGKEPARVDRYDYKQKFEYWGVIAGGILMTVTGLMLWFPTVPFQLFPWFPGELIPAAKMAHTNEAMMAFLIIVLWHIYNSVFSPEVFPFDTTILHGKISARRLAHEHPLEYERIVAEEAAAEAKRKAEEEARRAAEEPEPPESAPTPPPAPTA